jgi:8-oxo-dGTP pyrophosphatase MutT (NUDIX family)
MDLTLNVNDSILNIRVLVLLETSKGFVFEQHKKGFYYCIGGRIKINENSKEAAKRELKEETGLDIDDLKLVTVYENFFQNGTESNTHEFGFVYKASKVESINPDLNMFEFSAEEIAKNDIRPNILKDIILKDNHEVISYHLHQG